MRKLQPKDRIKVAIPDDLRNALKEVVRLVRQAKHDRDINIDYDDAIQVDDVICGGRYQKKPNRYCLTYYPRDKSTSGKWRLDLHQLDIEDIADGMQEAITLYCCTTPSCQMKASKPDVACMCDYVDE